MRLGHGCPTYLELKDILDAFKFLFEPEHKQAFVSQLSPHPLTEQSTLSRCAYESRAATHERRDSEIRRPQIATSMRSSRGLSRSLSLHLPGCKLLKRLLVMLGLQAGSRAEAAEAALG